MTKLLTPDEYVTRSITRHPSLYASVSPEIAKLAIYDHTFNVIGNGLLLEDFQYEAPTPEEYAQAAKWFSCSKLFAGYTQVVTEDNWTRPVGVPSVYVLEEEKANHPQVLYWVKYLSRTRFVPYPNFQKQYSQVWDSKEFNLTMLSSEWAKAADWFYAQCQAFFLDEEQVLHYFRAFPGQYPLENVLREWRAALKKYDSTEAISQAYGYEFEGDPSNDDDVARFCVRGWVQHREQVLAFLAETRDLLATRMA